MKVFKISRILRPVARAGDVSRQLDQIAFRDLLMEKCAGRHVAFAGPEDFSHQVLLAWIARSRHQCIGPLVPEFPPFAAVITEVRPRVTALLAERRQPTHRDSATRRLKHLNWSCFRGSLMAHPGRQAHPKPHFDPTELPETWRDGSRSVSRSFRCHPRIPAWIPPSPPQPAAGRSEARGHGGLRSA